MGDIGGFGQKSAAKSQRKGQSSRIRFAQDWAQPGAYTNWVAKAAPALQQVYEPARQRASEASAMGEQTGLQGLDADAARRGLSGSGYHLSGRQAIRGGRQARTNQALIQMYENALGTASREGGQTIRTLMSGAMGVPTTGVPSAGSTAADAGTDLLSLYLLFGI